MAIETKPWDAADYLHTEEDVADYLDATMESNCPEVYGHALQSAVRARGGLPSLSSESGVAQTDIEAAIAANDSSSFQIMQRVQLAYRQLAERRMVA